MNINIRGFMAIEELDKTIFNRAFIFKYNQFIILHLGKNSNVN